MYDDYLEACRVLDTIKIEMPKSLPRKNSKRSGVYFDRIINTENLMFLNDESLTLMERAYRIQKYVDIQGFLITIYTDLDNTVQYYNQELIELYIFGLTICQSMLDLGYRINESVEDAEIGMQSRFNTIQYVYITMVLFILENQEKESLFINQDLERLSNVISSSVQLNKDWMEPAAKEDIKQRLQNIVNNTSSGHIRGKYRSLIESM